MRRSTRQAARAANKARLSGTIISDPPKNKKIAFADEDEENHVGDVTGQAQSEGNDSSEQSNPIDMTDGSGTNDKDSNINEEDEAVEEVTGSAARASMQKSRDVERKISKESASKKKKKKRNIAVEDNTSNNVETDAPESDDESDVEDNEEILTDDFFKMVDSERASHSQKMKEEKRHKRIQQKKLFLGKHTTFVVDGDYGIANAPHPINSNIEVVALGEVGDGESIGTPRAHDERQLLTSATIGLAPSKAATTFARGSMSSGVSKERSSNGSRKRKSKDEETWKRTRKLMRLGVAHRPGQAATLFVRKTK